MLGFSLGIHLGGYLRYILDHFGLPKLKMSKISIFRRYRAIALYRYELMKKWFGLKIENKDPAVRFRPQGYQMKAVFKVDGEYQISDISRTIQGPKMLRNGSKFKFLARIFSTLSIFPSFPQGKYTCFTILR